MHVIVDMRLDISHVVRIVSRYMHDSEKEHWQVVKWILWYILNVVDVGLTFVQDDMVGQFVVGYYYSYYACDLDKYQSTTSYMFTLEKTPINWKSTLQFKVALSKIKVEYMTVTKVVKEMIYLQGLLKELGIDQNHVHKVHCNN